MYKSHRIKFYGNPSEGAAPLYAVRRTDITKLISDFHDYAAHSNNWVTDNIVWYNRVTVTFRYLSVSVGIVDLYLCMYRPNVMCEYEQSRQCDEIFQWGVKLRCGYRCSCSDMWIFVTLSPSLWCLCVTLIRCPQNCKWFRVRHCTFYMKLVSRNVINLYLSCYS